MNSLQRTLSRSKKMVDETLRRILPRKSQKPGLIHDAMRYSVLAGGKRLRPLLVMSAAELCGEKPAKVLLTACALELIHTYSLIHDDLPAMDDDELRRGKPTNHVVFGEDIAILAGDALLTLSFELLAKNAAQANLRPQDFYHLIKAVSQGAGTNGMIGGQVADIKSDQGRWKNFRRRPNADGLKAAPLLDYIHRKKTAALITASLEAGALLGKGSKREIEALRLYGSHIGLAFQIKDDILDRVGNKKKLGKKGSDASNQKLTFPALYGLDDSFKQLISHVRSAHAALALFGRRARVLHELADFIRDRDH